MTPRLGAQQPVEIAAEDAADIWSRRDGTGFANDVVRAAFRAVDRPVHLTVVPYARCKQMVRDGAVAGCLSMSDDPAIRSTVRFPALPLFVCRTELIYDARRPITAHRLADLPPGTRLGIVRGYEYPPAVDSARRAGRIRLEASSSEEILLRKLEAGHVDAALLIVNALKPLEYLTARARTTTEMRSAAPLGDMPAFLGFSARRSDAVQAQRDFERGMRRILANGELERISRRWRDTVRTAIRRAGTPNSRRHA